MVIDSFSFFLIRSLFFAAMFFLSTWILLPKAVFYYLEWKRTGKSNFLSTSLCLAAAGGLFLAANFAMFITACIGGV